MKETIIFRIDRDLKERAIKYYGRNLSSRIRDLLEDDLRRGGVETIGRFRGLGVSGGGDLVNPETGEVYEESRVEYDDDVSSEDWDG